MHCKVPQCAVRRLREEAEETRLLPQPAPMRGSRPLRLPQGVPLRDSDRLRATQTPGDWGTGGASQGISGKKLPLAQDSA